MFNVSSVIVGGSVESGTKENPSNTVGSNIFGAMLMIGWIGGIVQSAMTRRSWLRWRAYQQPGAWYVQSSGAPEATVATHDRFSPANADNLLRGARDSGAVVPAPRQGATGAWSPQNRGVASPVEAPKTTSRNEPVSPFVDLNRADAPAFMSIGLDQAWADWLIATRTRIGGFTTTEQLLTDGQMPPHLFARLRDRIRVQAPMAPPSPAPGRPGAGRLLDL